MTSGNHFPSLLPSFTLEVGEVGWAWALGRGELMLDCYRAVLSVGGRSVLGDIGQQHCWLSPLGEELLRHLVFREQGCRSVPHSAQMVIWPQLSAVLRPRSLWFGGNALWAGGCELCTWADSSKPGARCGWAYACTCDRAGRARSAPVPGTACGVGYSCSVWCR